VPAYTHTDALGSVVRRTDGFGNQLPDAQGGRASIEPYGSLSAGAWLQGQPGFTGHVADTTSGLHYMQQRYYDPIAMRFLSVDPVAPSAADGSNFNRYWYANNNPYKFVDPDGRENVLGVVARFSDEVESPTAADRRALADVQRSVDLTVETVVASGDTNVISDAQAWSVEYDPTYENADNPRTLADTIVQGTQGSADDPQEISTVYTKIFSAIVNSPGAMRGSEGITSTTKDAKLLVTGLHELSHGSEGNRRIASERESEADVGGRVRELIKHSPTVRDGYR
jgi:RHS repeat-associated protein